MNKVSIFLFLLFFWPGVSSLSAEEIDCSFDVNVELINQASGKYEIIVKLKNVSNNALKIYKYDLPWLSRNNMLLVAVMVNSPVEIIKAYSEIADPSIEEIAIMKGETISGRIALNNKFPSIENVLKHNDVIIFWSYAMSLTHGLSKERYGGYLLIEKATKGSRERE
jgi:hypothetical protein